MKRLFAILAFLISSPGWISPGWAQQPSAPKADSLSNPDHMPILKDRGRPADMPTRKSRGSAADMPTHRTYSAEHQEILIIPPIDPKQFKDKPWDTLNRSAPDSSQTTRKKRKH